MSASNAGAPEKLLSSRRGAATQWPEGQLVDIGARSNVSPLLRAAAMLAALLPAAVLLWLLAKAGRPASYDDFVVGSLAWYQGGKLQDLLAPPLALAAFAGLLAWNGRSLQALVSHQGPERAQAVAAQWLWWTVPAALALAPRLLGGAADRGLLLLSTIGLIAVSLAVAVQLRRREPVDAERVGHCLLTGLALGLWPLALALLLGRAVAFGAPMGWLGASERLLAAVPGLATAGLLAGAALSLLRGPRCLALLRRAVPVAQAGLVGLLLCLMPAGLVTTDAPFIDYPSTGRLAWLVLPLLMLALGDVWRRRAAAPDWVAEGSGLRTLWSPWVLLGLLLALRFGGTLPPHVRPDDYHFGERLIGLLAYGQGALPYVDYLPAHGLLEDDLGAALSALFFDGRAGTVVQGGVLGLALLGSIAFLAMYAATGHLLPAGLALLLIGTEPAWSFWLLLLAVACAWFSTRLAARSGRWLMLWSGSAVLLVLAAPSFGVLATLASLPMAAVQGRRWWLGRGRSAWRPLAAVVAGWAALLAATPLARMLAGAIRYVADNGAVNQLAYGIPWALSWTPAVRSGLLFEALRMGWLAAVALCGGWAWRAWRTPGADAALRWPPVFLLLLGLLLMPYSMGRIDPGDVSRAGQASVVLLMFMLPLVLWPRLAPPARAGAALLLAFVAAAVNPSSLASASIIAAAVPRVPADLSKDGTAAGLPGLARGWVDDAQWARLQRVRAALDERLKPGAPYLDLTNRSAQHAYLGRPSPLPVPAPYNLVAPGQQQRAVATLAAAPPGMVLMAADTIVHDGGGLALRNPALYRFVLSHYLPREANGLIVGDLRPAGAGSVPSAEQVLLFERAFALADLGALPRSWGRSEARLLSRMHALQRFDDAAWTATHLQHDAGARRISGAQPSLSLDLRARPLNGAEGGLLRFELRCANPQPTARVRLSWWGDLETSAQRPAQVSFSADPGVVIVPLDAQPRWALMRRIEGLSLHFDQAAGCAVVDARGAALLRRLPA